MSPDVAIQVSNLSKCYHIYDNPRDRLKQFFFKDLVRCSSRTYYREFWALRDVSFQIKRGETVGIIGRNGSGKSTLLQMICGTLTPTSGSIYINGRVAALLELGAGFNPEFTGRENVYMSAALLGLTSEETSEIYDDIVNFSEIGDFIDQPVKTYSSGMFVRLAFSVQASVSPDVLVVDEALAVGDAYFVHKCMYRFNQLRERGTTILFVSHDATAVKTLCDMAIWVDRGIIEELGDTATTVDSYLANLSSQQRLVSPSESVNVSCEANYTDKYVRNFNGKLRFGNQKCVFTEITVCDKAGNPTDSVQNDSSIYLRMKFRNNSLHDESKLIVGYSLRNVRGIDIASGNTDDEGMIIYPPRCGAEVIIEFKMGLPLLHPGSYSFRASISYVDESGKLVGADDIVNAIVFNISSEQPVHVLLALRSNITVMQEHRDDGKVL